MSAAATALLTITIQSSAAAEVLVLWRQARAHQAASLRIRSLLGQSPTACVQIDRRMRRLVMARRSNGEEPASPRHRADAASMAGGDRHVGRHRKHMMCAPPYTEPKDSHTSVKGIALWHEYTKQLPVHISSTLSSTVSAQDPMDVAGDTCGRAPACYRGGPQKKV